MSLCGLMQMDFKFGTGRREPDTGQELYSDRDLQFGVDYCTGWLAEGETRDLIGGFDLVAFRDWCLLQLHAGGHR